VLQIVKATGASVEVVSPLMRNWRIQAMRAASIPVRLTGRGMAWPKHPFLLRDYAAKADAAVRKIKPDLVFSPGTNVVAYSEFLRPTIFWSDAPFASLMDYYPWPQYQRLAEWSRRQGLEADTRALRYSVAGIFRSHWARDCAIQAHQGDPSKIHVVPLPGNLTRQWSLAEVNGGVKARLQSPWKILFSGVDWERKGGDRAVAIINELVRLGQPCELKVAGVIPPAKALAAAHFPVYVLGKQNLNDEKAREVLADLMQESTFLLVPAVADAMALVFCEALSAGLPPVGTAIGGTFDVISDRKTGLLIPTDEPPATTAQHMLEAGEPAAYQAMAEACWHKWQVGFSKTSIVAELTRILEKADQDSHDWKVP